MGPCGPIRVASLALRVFGTLNLSADRDVEAESEYADLVECAMEAVVGERRHRRSRKKESRKEPFHVDISI